MISSQKKADCGNNTTLESSTQGTDHHNPLMGGIQTKETKEIQEIKKEKRDQMKLLLLAPSLHQAQRQHSGSP